MKELSNTSLIIPIFNESENINQLFEDIKKNNLNQLLNKIIYVDDFSTDDSIKKIEEITINNKNVILLKQKKNMGQSACILLGAKYSKDKQVILMDGDCQNDPKDIFKLSKIFFNDTQLKLVGGLRKNRKDPIFKILASRIANSVRKNILRDNCDDTGCSLKILDRKILISFPFFDGLHRFLPALYLGYGFKTDFTEVNHRRRHSGISKYDNFKRLINGIKDLIKVQKIIKKKQ